MSTPFSYYIIAFLEGIIIMAIELAGAKIIGSYYGTTLYVWTSVLAVTLAGLTFGYWMGGNATQRYSSEKVLFIILLGTAFLTSFLPGLALSLVPATQGLSVRLGSLVSAIGLLFLPLAVVGMSSPALIQLSTKSMEASGKSAGNIYAVSTIGGILSAIIMGFYLLPDWGVRNTLFLIVGILLVGIISLYIQQRQNGFWMLASFAMIAIVMIASIKPFTDPKRDLKFLYRSEGILGQVSVLDNPHPETNRLFRLLMINQIPQTQDNVAILPVSGWSYPHRLATLASVKPAGSKVLLIGMGGGNIAMELKKMGFQVDIVEIDERMPFVAEKYFAFESTGMDVFIDDGRHFIRNAQNKYDVVITDVLNGEVQPYHLFTQEAFEDLKKILNPQALVLVNFQGYLLGENGRAARSMYKTMQNAGFNMQYYFSGDEQNDGDLHFIASLGKPDYSAVDDSRLNECCKVMPHTYNDLVTSKPLDVADAIIFTDDKPQLEIMNVAATEMWRKRTIDTYLTNLPTYKIPFFK